MQSEEASFRWHNWSVHGTENQIDAVLEYVNGHLPSGWRHLKDDELAPLGSLVRKGSSWYAMETSSDHGGATLSIERFIPTMLRGGRVLFHGPPYAKTSAEAGVIAPLFV